MDDDLNAQLSALLANAGLAGLAAAAAATSTGALTSNGAPANTPANAIAASNVVPSPTPVPMQTHPQQPMPNQSTLLQQQQLQQQQMQQMLLQKQMQQQQLLQQQQQQQQRVAAAASSNPSRPVGAAPVVSNTPNAGVPNQQQQQQQQQQAAAAAAARGNPSGFSLSFDANAIAGIVEEVRRSLTEDRTRPQASRDRMNNAFEGYIRKTVQAKDFLNCARDYYGPSEFEAVARRNGATLKPTANSSAQAAAQAAALAAAQAAGAAGATSTPGSAPTPSGPLDDNMGGLGRGRGRGRGTLPLTPMQIQQQHQQMQARLARQQMAGSSSGAMPGAIQSLFGTAAAGAFPTSAATSAAIPSLHGPSPTLTTSTSAPSGIASAPATPSASGIQASSGSTTASAAASGPVSKKAKDDSHQSSADLQDIMNFSSVNEEEERELVRREIEPSTEKAMLYVRQAAELDAKETHQPLMDKKTLAIKISSICRKYEIEYVDEDVYDYVSQAVQEYLRGMIEDLIVASRHRQEVTRGMLEEGGFSVKISDIVSDKLRYIEAEEDDEIYNENLIQERLDGKEVPVRSKKAMQRQAAMERDNIGFRTDAANRTAQQFINLPSKSWMQEGGAGRGKGAPSAGAGAGPDSAAGGADAGKTRGRGDAPEQLADRAITLQDAVFVLERSRLRTKSSILYYSMVKLK